MLSKKLLGFWVILHWTGSSPDSRHQCIFINVLCHIIPTVLLFSELTLIISLFNKKLSPSLYKKIPKSLFGRRNRVKNFLT